LRDWLWTSWSQFASRVPSPCKDIAAQQEDLSGHYQQKRPRWGQLSD
jgi:hypothetical protein